MPRCDCGFDLARARLTARRVESYALISEDNYGAVLRKENAILEETNPRKRLALIGKAASAIGNLVRCPECGAWLLAKPLRRGQGAYTVLRETQRADNLKVRQAGARRVAQKAKRVSAATRPRR